MSLSFSRSALLRCVSVIAVVAQAALPAASASSLPTLRTITVDGQFSDWNQILLNPLQVTTDGNASSVNNTGCFSANPDRDCPNINGNGRDILTFAWTYDSTNIYTYLRRENSTSAVMNYFFIMDLDADGIAESSDKVAQVRWSGGGNVISYLRIFPYLPFATLGDSMACSVAARCPSPGGIGFVDGYNMPGMLGLIPDYDSGAQTGGSVTGDRFEVAFPWAALGVAYGSPILWHVSSNTNTSFSDAIDNAGGPDGRAGTFGVFAATFAPDRNGATSSPGTIDYCHTVANTGQFPDSYNLSGTSSTGTGIAIYSADAACTRGVLMALDANGDGDFTDVGDTAPAPGVDTNSDSIPDTNTVAAGTSRNFIFQVRVPAGRTNSTDRVRATASSTRRTDISGTVVDTTAIGAVSVFPNLTASGTPGLTVLVGPHSVQNNQAASDDFDLQVLSESGWRVSLYADAGGSPGALIATDTNGDGVWDSTAPTTGAIAAGARRDYWLRATIAAGAAVGSTSRVTLKATSRSNPASWGEAIDVLQVFPALQLLPSYSAAANTALVGAPGSLVYLAHRIINSRDVAESVSLSQTATPVAGYTIRWFTDPDGDGNPADGAQISGALAVPPFGGQVNIVTEISIPASGTPAAFPAITTATGLGSSASAADNVTVGQLATFRDPLYSLSDRVFPACSTIYVQAEGLTASTTTTYQVALVNPSGTVIASKNLSTDPRAVGRSFFDLSPSDAPGNYRVRLSQGATVLRELNPVVVERSGSAVVLAPATAQNGQLLAVSAQLTNTSTQSAYASTRVDFELRDPLGNLFRSASINPLDVAFSDVEITSTAWAGVTFATYGNYTLTVTWSTSCGSVIATASQVIVAKPVAPTLTSPPHNSVVTTATPALQGTALAGATVSVYVDGVLVGTGTGPSFSVVPPALGQGAHTWYATQTVGGTASAPSVTFAFTLDSVAPDTTIASGPASGSITSSNAATFGFTANDPTATFECSLDGAAFAACTTPAAYSALAEGSHTFAVRARDLYGNLDATPASRTWTVDRTPPDTTVSGPSSPTNSTSATLTFGSPDSTATFECSLDGAAYAVCTTPDTRTGLLEGAHTFDVRAVDLAGNVDLTPARHSWTVDITAPDTSVSGPASPTSATTATLTFSSLDATATFECSLDGAAYAACTSPQVRTGLLEGVHTFDVRATDSAGNTDATPARHTWTIDLTAPDTTVSGPASPTNLTTATLTFGSPDTGATFACSLDGAPFTACTSPRALSGLGEGQHSFRVRATDSANNTDATPAEHLWTVDLTAPDTTVSGPASPSNATTATLTFGSPDGTATFACSLDGAAYAPCTSPRVLTGLTAGPHTFDVRATDPAGNTDASPARHSWTIDRTPPDTTLSGPPALTRLTSATLTFSADETSTFTCTLDGAAYTPCVSPVSLSGLSDASHSFVVTATDVAGNVETSPAQHTWVVDTTPPQTTLTDGPPPIDSAPNPSFSFVSSESGSSFECSLDGTAFAPCTSPRAYAGLADGPHSFEVRATDPATNTDPTPAAMSWTVDSNIPDTTIVSGPARYSAVDAAQFVFSSSAGPTATFQCSVDGGPFLPCFSPVDLSSVADGDHTFAVFSTSGAGIADPDPELYPWTVDTVLPDTTVTGPASPSASSSASLSFGADETFVTYQCSVDSGSFGPCTTPVALGGLSDGPHRFEVYATDRAGNFDASPAVHLWEVDTTPPDTSVTGPAALTASTSATFGFSSPDDAAASFECSLDGAPYAGCAAPLTFTGLGEGAHSFAVRGFDAAGNRDPSAAEHAWTIDLTPPDTLVAGPTSPTNATSAALTFSSPDDAGATFECSLDGAPFTGCTSPLTVSGLSAGERVFQVRAVDSVLNADASPAEHRWTIDLSAPDTTVSGPGLSNVTTATFTFSGEEVSDTFECALDSEAFAPCTAPVTRTGLIEGSHTFHVRATDEAGNTDPTPAEHTWIIDLTPPDTTLSGPSTTVATRLTSADFTVGSPDGATEFECALDGEAFASCPSSYSRSGLGEGSHTLLARAVDDAGNPDPTPASLTWVIDLTPPDTTLSGPAALTHLADATLTFDADEDATFTCSLDGAVAVDCTSPQTLTNLSDGDHTFTVLATDLAGNEELAAATHAWTVDTTPPDTQISSGPVAIDSSASARFVFGSLDADTTGFECSLDGAAFSGCNSPWDLSALGDGAHTFEVRAVDAATNVDPSPASFGWTVDTSLPDTSFTATPPEFSNSAAASVSFGSTATPATFECSVDGALPFTSCGSPLTLSGLADGPHSVEVRSRNQAGTVDPSPALHDWAVDTLAPDTDLSGPPAVTAVTVATFNFSATETGVSFECNLDGAGWTACTEPVTLTGVSEGDHLLEVRATDRATNVEPVPAQHAWTVDRTPPDTGITGPVAQDASASATLSFTATESGSVFECSLDGAVFDPCPSSVTLTGLSEGPHAMRVRAIDGVGNTDGSPAEHLWTTDLTAPDTSILSGPAALVNSAAADFSFGSPDTGAVFECSVDGAAFTACGATLSLSALADGSHHLEVRARDAAGNVDAAPSIHDWTVDTVPPETTFDQTPLAEDRETEATFTYASSEPGALLCSLDGAAFAPCASPLELSGLSEGPHTLEVRGVDQAGNVDPTPARWEWNIDVNMRFVGGGCGCGTSQGSAFAFAGAFALLALLRRRRRV